MMKTTRKRQRIISLTSATAVVCDNLFMFGTRSAPHWSWHRQGPKRKTASEKAFDLLEKLQTRALRADK